MKKRNIIIIGVVLLIIVIGAFILFVLNNNYEITFNTDGGSLVSKIKIKKGDLMTLPESPTKEGYVFGGFIYNDNILVTGNTKFSSDMTLNARWISEDKELVEITFDNDGKTITTVCAKGDATVFIETPSKSGFIFGGWENDEGYIIDKNSIITKSMTLKPRWIKLSDKTFKVSFNSNGGNSIEDILVVSGSTIVLPNPPKKDGYRFDGWVLSNGTVLNEKDTVDRDMTITAEWVLPYTCPSGCAPSADMKTCTKTITESVSDKKSCDSGYTLKNNKCLNYSKKYHADNTGGWHCNNKSDYMYTEEDGVGGAYMWCVPTKSVKVTSECSDGYTLKDNKCVKTEILNCTRDEE